MAITTIRYTVSATGRRLFELYALSEKLGLPASTSRADLLNAMNGKVLSKGVYIGIFGRK
jgi:phosphatidylethanolamine-binding protein (PEBP) family uncharacterized protein